MKVVGACHDTLNQQNSLDSSSYNSRLAYIVAAISHIFAPGESLDHDVGSLADAAFHGDAEQDKKARAAVKQYIQDSASDTMHTMGCRMWTAWDNEKQTFVSAMQGAVNAKTSKIIQSSDNGWSLERTESGENLASFISKFRSNSVFKADAPGVGNRSTEQDLWNSNSQHWYDGGGCFVAGTEVMTEGGQSIPIEQIREGTPVLTRADTNELGWASDELVEISIGGQEITLFGLNQDEPFFTSNHVFMTTGGHRALNPEGARRENPYLEVGHLQVGDVVFQTTGDNIYETITIEKIPVKRVALDYVYGVHLREGLRSYHANGYLVYLNYPEITLASLGRSILAMTHHEQLKILSSFYELRPLLERFGGPLVLDAFHKQLAENGAKTLPQKSSTSTLLDADQCYELVSQEGKALANLPLLTVHRGLLQVGPEACEYYSLLSRRITWSRPIDNGQSWEHGLCRLQDDLAGGAGYILHSEKFHPTKSEWAAAARISCFARSSHLAHSLDEDPGLPVHAKSSKLERRVADNNLAAAGLAPQPKMKSGSAPALTPTIIQRFNLKSVSEVFVLRVV